VSRHHESPTLVTFLDAQRESVLAIVDGLDEYALRTTVVPSGWTPLGLVEHLGRAERYWFQHVAAGSVIDVPWPEEPVDDEAPFTSARAVDVVFRFYRDQCDRANEVLATMPLSSLPRGKTHPEMADLAVDLRSIVLHMIEETARHAGHLDIARELIDGRTGLGPR
jgi:uncharacterized damage-inducible protein DinB